MINWVNWIIFILLPLNFIEYFMRTLNILVRFADTEKALWCFHKFLHLIEATDFENFKLCIIDINIREISVQDI